MGSSLDGKEDAWCLPTLRWRLEGSDSSTEATTAPAEVASMGMLPVVKPVHRDAWEPGLELQEIAPLVE